MPFTRCMRCNGLLDHVEKEQIQHRLLPKTRRYYDEFAACRDCGRLYWKGSHYQDMQRRMDQLVSGAARTRIR